MSQSVKLSDGSYIDAGAVWDATQGKTQEEINADDGCSMITVTMPTTGTWGVDAQRIFKQGKMVALHLAFQRTDAAIAAGSVILTVPEGYRTRQQLRAALQSLFGTPQYAIYLKTNGDVIASQEIPAGSYVGIDITYLTT